MTPDVLNTFIDRVAYDGTKYSSADHPYATELIQRLLIEERDSDAKVVHDLVQAVIDLSCDYHEVRG